MPTVQYCMGNGRIYFPLKGNTLDHEGYNIIDYLYSGLSSKIVLTTSKGNSCGK